MKKFSIRNIIRILLSVVIALLLSGCIPAADGNLQQSAGKLQVRTEETREGKESKEEKKSKEEKASKEGKKSEEEKTSKEEKEIPETIETKQESITEDGIYHDLESVVLYYDKFGHLPSNFVTKKEAKDLGWEGGRLDPYVKDGSIGGDHFGNYEKRLPSGKGIKYIECDIDTDGGRRGSKRLIISNDGRYYYTADHYDSFREVMVENGNVVFAD